MTLLYFNSYEDFIDKAVSDIISAADIAINKKNRFDIVLSGGQTPLPVYRKLVKQDTDWSSWHIWLSDERDPDPDETVLNWKMIKDAFLHSVPIPETQFHRIETEKGVQVAAFVYDLELHNTGQFDLVILGLGEDGHTASLFPGMDRSSDVKAPAAFPILRSPKPPRKRVTLSISRLCNAKEILFLVSGTAKKSIVVAMEKNKEIPASRIKGTISTKLLYFEPL